MKWPSCSTRTGCRISTEVRNLKLTSAASQAFSKEITKWAAWRLRTSRRDPSGFQRAEAFWNSRGHGLRPWSRGQFQLSFSLEPRWVSALSVKSAAGFYLPILLKQHRRPALRDAEPVSVSLKKVKRRRVAHRPVALLRYGA